jgi:hypothetical protein
MRRLLRDESRLVVLPGMTQPNPRRCNGVPRRLPDAAQQKTEGASTDECAGADRESIHRLTAKTLPAELSCMGRHWTGPSSSQKVAMGEPQDLQVEL